jgi:hypothetical protein
MKKIINVSLASIFLLAMFAACSDNLPIPDPSFRIEKDTIINSIKKRVEVSFADTKTPLYFVYEGASTFNSLWPGDKFLATTVINESPTVKNKRVTYYVSQDYGARKDSIILSLVMKRDTFMTQAAIVYQGIALPFGTTEILYTFKSKGDLTVTWVSGNANGKETNQQIQQKKIRVN